MCEPCVLGDGVASPRVYVRIPSPCLQPVSSFSLFFLIFFSPLTLSIPLLLPFAMILLRDPSSRSFFEMEVNGGGKRVFFSERVSMKSSSKTNQRDCNEVDSWSR